MIVQFCGLSGAGKTTLANRVQQLLHAGGWPVEILDGDEYRKSLCRDLGFSKEDRHENILRMAFVASKLSKHGIVALVSAINPYQQTRDEVATRYKNVKTVYVDCPVDTLIERDTKGLYRKALLPADHPDKIQNLTGINDPFEAPPQPDVYINTALHDKETCARRIVDFIKAQASSARLIETRQQESTMPHHQSKPVGNA